jgi:hypothetical protein
MRELGLEVPTEHANAAYNDSDSYSDGDDEDDDDDDDDSAPVRKTARLVPSNGDGQMGAAPAAGAAVACRCRWVAYSDARFAYSDALCNHNALCKPPSAGAGAGSFVW